jgi:hypothetical protein
MSDDWEFSQALESAGGLVRDGAVTRAAKTSLETL